MLKIGVISEHLPMSAQYSDYTHETSENETICDVWKVCSCSAHFFIFYIYEQLFKCQKEEPNLKS